MQNRVEWVDILKGIAIFIVVLGHLPVAHSLRQWIYIFHMPLFFLVSGLFLFKSLEQSDGAFFKKRFVRLMVPYYVWGYGLMIPFYLAIAYVTYVVKGVASWSELYNLPGHLIGQLLGIRSWEIYACNLWFLPCLLLSSFMVWLIWKRCAKYKWSILTIMTVTGIVYNRMVGISLPFCADMALVAAPFIAVGWYVVEKVECLKWPGAIVLLLLGTTCGLINGKVDMYEAKLGNHVLLFYIAAFSLCMFTVWSAGVVARTKNSKIKDYLKSMGRASLSIYILHFPAVHILGGVICKVLGVRDIAGLSTAYAFIVAVAIIVAIMPLHSWIVRKVPWTMGDFKKRG